MSEDVDLPCPFCGESDLYVREASRGAAIQVVCGGCGASGPEAPRDIRAECSGAGMDEDKRASSVGNTRVTATGALGLNTQAAGHIDGLLPPKGRAPQKLFPSGVDKSTP